MATLCGFQILYDRVEVGDVGYVRQGYFLRLFNALLPANHHAQVYGVPDGFVPIDMGPFVNIRVRRLARGDFCSHPVRVYHGIGDQILAAYVTSYCTNPIFSSYTKGDSSGGCTDALYRCGSSPGAFLSLPFDVYCEDVIRTKSFETYIRNHCDSWLEFAITNASPRLREDVLISRLK